MNSRRAATGRRPRRAALVSRPTLEGERRAACACLATLLDLLRGMKRDLASPTLDALHAECVALVGELDRLDLRLAMLPGADRLRTIAGRLVSVGEGLDDITASFLSTCDEVRIRAAAERLIRFSEFLSRHAQSRVPATGRR